MIYELYLQIVCFSLQKKLYAETLFSKAEMLFSDAEVTIRKYK